MEIPTLEEFVQEFYRDPANKKMYESELGRNGQFDDIPYGIYEEKYGRDNGS